MRTYFRTTYKYSEVYDSPIYKEAALILNRELMMKLSSIPPKEANESFEEICIVHTEQLTIEEMKEIVAYFWNRTISRATGCLNGLWYKDLRPNSFEVRIQEQIEENAVIEKRTELHSKNNKIIECFAMEDMNPILLYYNERQREIESQIKTVADCL